LSRTFYFIYVIPRAVMLSTVEAWWVGPRAQPFDGAQGDRSRFFSSLPTGGVRQECVVAERGDERSDVGVSRIDVDNIK